MNDRMILQLLDAERETIADTDVTLEKTPYVVRAIGIGTEGSWNGIVYSHFSIAEAEEVINDEISYFVKIGRGFEWKVYSPDYEISLSLPVNLIRQFCLSLSIAMRLAK